LIVDLPAEAAVAVEDGPPVAAKKSPATKISLIDAYGGRFEPSGWLSTEFFESDKHGIYDVSLFEFASRFKVGERKYCHKTISLMQRIM
jgi:hypothetical protein